LTSLGTRSWTTLLAAAEEGVEDIAETKTTGPTKWVIAAIVVVSTSVGIAQHFVCVCDQLEPLLRFWSRIYVWVQFPGELAISLLDLILGGTAIDT
jgi:hypothetical protein